MSFLEETYLQKISYQLPLFKKKRAHLYNWRCTICNDSQKKKNATRAYAMDKGGSLLIYCHNCGYSAKFEYFLKEFDPQTYKLFIMERFQERTKRALNEPLFPVETKKYVPDIFHGLPTLKSLPNDHDAKVYADKRVLPYNDFKFYYAEKFIEWSKDNNDKFENWKGADERRIIIPFYARDGHIVGYTARTIDGKEPKYYRIFVDDQEKDRFFGVERLDDTKPHLIFEGELDSLVIPNSIAVSNGKLSLYRHPNAVYVPDADRRNKEIVKGIGQMISEGLKVVLMPEGLPGKDVSELVVAGYTSEQIRDIIMANVVQGLSGKLKFDKWRKC